MKADFYLVKVCLVPKVRNNPVEMPRFSALEASAFLAQIHFFNFVVHWLLQLFSIYFFLFQLSTWLFLSPCSEFSSLWSAFEVIFRIGMSEAVSLLNLWMNC